MAIRIRLYYLYVGLLSLLGGCNNATPHSIIFDDIVTVNLSELEELSINDLCSDITLLPLETSQQSLLGYVEKIELTDDYIFIYDANKRLTIFDYNGKFISKSKPIGRGPTEFHTITHFCINHDNNYVLIYDGTQSKIKIYDGINNWKYISERKLPSALDATELLFLEDGKILANLRLSPETNSYYEIIDINNLSSNNELLNYPFRWTISSAISSGPKMSKTDDGLYLVSLMSDTIYMCKQSNIYPKFYFNSGMKSIYEVDFNPQLEDYASLYQLCYPNNDITTGVDCIINTEYMGYTRTLIDKERYHIFWDLYSGNGCKIIARPSKDIVSNLHLYTATKDAFVGVLYPYEISKEQLCDDRFAALHNVNEDDNPILVFYKVEQYE